MKTLFNRKIVNHTTSETKGITREEVVALFGEERVAGYERIKPTVVTQTWVDRLIRKFWMTDDVIFNLGMEVYLEHAEKILYELGMSEDNDGILDRIVMYTKIPEKGDYRGVFHHTAIHRGFMGSHGSEYQRGSGRIEVNSLAPFYYHTKEGYKEMKPARLWFFKKKLKQTITFILAHEMRHYWQYYTGVVFRKSYVGSLRLMPYEWRWEEKDANEFAFKYAYGKKK